MHKTSVFLLGVLLFVSVLGLDSSSDSSSSESSEGEGHQHHHHEKGGGDRHTCEDGWKYFKRPSGGWCVKVILEYGPSIPTAINRCKEKKAVLSGIQNTEERLWIVQDALTKINTVAGCFWLGVQRTAACMNSALTSTCTQLNSFEWTDNSTTGTAGFSWRSTPTQQPDNSGGNQDRAFIIAANAATPSVYTRDANGSFDDNPGILSTVSVEADCPISGYVCGKWAV